MFSISLLRNLSNMVVPVVFIRFVRSGKWWRDCQLTVIFHFQSLLNLIVCINCMARLDVSFSHWLWMLSSLGLAYGYRRALLFSLIIRWTLCTNLLLMSCMFVVSINIYWTKLAFAFLECHSTPLWSNRWMLWHSSLMCWKCFAFA